MKNLPLLEISPNIHNKDQWMLLNVIVDLILLSDWYLDLLKFLRCFPQRNVVHLLTNLL